MSGIFIDSFDHNGDEPKGLRGAALDAHILETSTRVSVFWITETQARAERVTNWLKDGTLVFDNKIGYPWNTVVSFRGKALKQKALESNEQQE